LNCADHPGPNLLGEGPANASHSLPFRLLPGTDFSLLFTNLAFGLLIRGVQACSRPRSRRLPRGDHLLKHLPLIFNHQLSFSPPHVDLPSSACCYSGVDLQTRSRRISKTPISPSPVDRRSTTSGTSSQCSPLSKANTVSTPPSHPITALQGHSHAVG
jgi:hypothetical protein